MPSSTDEVAEFKQWLKAQQLILKKYTPDEIAYLAVLAGFSKDLVRQEVLEGSRNVHTNTCQPLRHWWTVERELEYIINDAKLYLAEKWERLCAYQTGEDVNK